MRRKESSISKVQSEDIHNDQRNGSEAPKRKSKSTKSKSSIPSASEDALLEDPPKDTGKSTMESLLSGVTPNSSQVSETEPQLKEEVKSKKKSKGKKEASYHKDNGECVPLQDIVKALKELPDASYINEIAQARLHSVEKYIEELKKSSVNHPRLQNRQNLEALVDCIRVTNSQKTALICIDIEAFERSLGTVTEVGISIYDPIKEATSLVPSMINIHIMLKESLKLRNGAFVHDNKDNFLGGNSMVMNKQNTRDLVQSLINYYFTERQKDGYDARFVFHNGTGDLKWIQSLGVQLPPNYESLDTQKIYTATHGKDGSSLGAVLRRFNIPHSFLHNAGNDAYYTLVALMKMSDPHFRTVRKLDDYKEDAKYKEFVEHQQVLAGIQSQIPKKITRPRKHLKSHEFAPYLEYSSHETALLKVFEYHS